MHTPSNEKIPKSFRVPVERIPELGLEIDETLSADWLSALVAEPTTALSWHAVEGALAHFELQPEAGMVRLTGHGSFKLAHLCVRCMQEAQYEVPLTFNMRLTPATQTAAEIEQDVEMFDDEDLVEATQADDGFSSATYENGVIDLSVLLREELFLTAPAYPTCDDPAGLSPQVCRFEELAQRSSGDWTAARWGKLLDLSKRLPKS